MEEYLHAFGTLAALGGAVLMVRGLVLHTTFKDGDGRFRPSGAMTSDGKKHFLRGLLLVVLGHVLRDVIPGMMNAGGSP